MPPKTMMTLTNKPIRRFAAPQPTLPPRKGGGTYHKLWANIAWMSGTQHM